MNPEEEPTQTKGSFLLEKLTNMAKWVSKSGVPDHGLPAYGYEQDR